MLSIFSYISMENKISLLKIVTIVLSHIATFISTHYLAIFKSDLRLLPCTHISKTR